MKSVTPHLNAAAATSVAPKRGANPAFGRIPLVRRLISPVLDFGNSIGRENSNIEIRNNIKIQMSKTQIKAGPARNSFFLVIRIGFL